MAGLLAAAGEAAAGAGAAVGDMAAGAGSAIGDALSSAGGSAVETAGASGAGGGGLGSLKGLVSGGSSALAEAGDNAAIQKGAMGGLMDNANSLFGTLQKIQGASNNNPNSGMVGASQSQQDPAMSQMMQQAMQQTSQQQPYKKVEFDPLPWQNQAGDIVKRREGQQGTMNLSGLLSMLTNGSLPLHSINDTGGSGAGGTSGGLVKSILSK
jgi:hypothetical protein